MNEDIRLGLVVGGAALLVVAVLWRLTTRSRTRRAPSPAASASTYSRHVTPVPSARL